MQPERIQRQRIKGWRMPANTIYVGRGTIWGNPWKIDENTTRATSLYNFRKSLELTAARNPSYFELLLAPLRGKNLACFCAPGDACHADIWLEFANGKETS